MYEIENLITLRLEHCVFHINIITGSRKLKIVFCFKNQTKIVTIYSIETCLNQNNIGSIHICIEIDPKNTARSLYTSFNFQPFFP